MRTALVTVSSESYLKGTQLMFYSFLKHHPNFKGELIVINTDLKEQDKSQLESLFKVKCIKVETKLKEKIDQLLVALPEYKHRKSRFYSLQSFNLNYDSILFVDSDVIFRKNVDELFDLEEPFSACLDWHSIQGGRRDLNSFSADSGQGKQTTFNAGFFYFKPSQLDSKIYDKLLNRLSVEQFKKLKSGHTDQYILNQEFGGSFNQLDSKYNTFVLPRTNKTQIQDFTGASVWHYLRHPKPWKHQAWIKRYMKGSKVPSPLRTWNQLYWEFSKKKNHKMSWKQRFLSAIILLISPRD